MTEVVFTFWDLEIMYLELVLGIIVYVLIRSYFEKKNDLKGGDNE